MLPIRLFLDMARRSSMKMESVWPRSELEPAEESRWFVQV
jgi:hypothetical protein